MILILLLFTGFVSYDLGSLDAKESAVRDSSLCIDHENSTKECYSIYLEEMPQ